MTRKLHISPTLALPLDAVTQTFAFLARRGAGKTYAAGKLAEEMLDAGAQVVVLDPVGNWYGLRLSANGQGKGIDIPVLGGEHGDIPLEPGAGALVADLIIERGISAVLDVSTFRKGQRKTFVTDFAEELFHRKKTARSPVHVIFEEAQVFVPQRALGDDARMLGAMEDLIKLGRNYGIGASLLSQRPQAVNKDVLNQTECLFTLQTTGPQERKVIEGWIVEKGGEVTKAVKDLPSLPQGTAWVWSPQWLGIFDRVKIGKKRTYDASATPTFGSHEHARELAPLDLDKLREAMKETIAKAEEKDPRALLRLVAELRGKIAKLERGKAPPPPAAPKLPPPPPSITEAQIKRLEAASARAEKAAAGLREAVALITPRLRVPDVDTMLGAPPPRPPPRPAHQSRPFTAAQYAAPSPVNGHAKRPAAAEGDLPPLKKGARAMLAALAMRHPTPLTREQVAMLSGMGSRGGTFGQYLSALRAHGFLAEPGGNFAITPAGLDYLGPHRPPAAASTEDLIALWSGKLKAGARKMLAIVVDSYPHAVTREELSERSGIAQGGGTFGQYLSALRVANLIDEEHSAHGAGGFPKFSVRASQTLFPEGRS